MPQINPITGIPAPPGNNPTMEYLTLRDHFAGLAMQGIWSNPKFTDMPSSEIAQWAYNQADHMLEVRKK